MPVPLLVDVVDGADGRTRVRATLVGGETVVALPPILPYAYTDRPVASPATPRTLKSLSTLQPETWYYGEWMSSRRRGWQLKGYKEAGGRVAEDLRFVEQVVADAPDFVRTLAAGTRRPRVLYVDIEQQTDGESFPKPTDPIVSFAYAVDDGPVHVVIRRDGVGMAEAFAAVMEQENPDIVAGFYHEGYDLRVLIEQLGQQSSRLTRDGSLPELSEKPERDGKVRKTVRLGGRVVWDVKPSTEIDMELSGCADRKLKTIADWLDIPYLTVDDYDIDALTDDELRAYNASDVEVLRKIAARYLGDRLALAEDIGSSYDRVLNGGSAYAAGIHAARACAAAGVVSDAPNEQRYDPFIPRETEGPRKGRPLKPEGATVAIMKRGRHAPIGKADYASLYPSEIVALGIGPDNVRMVRYEDHPQDALANEPALVLLGRTGDTRHYRVIDRAMLTDDKGNGPVRLFFIDVVGRSVFADRIGAMMRERLAIKKQAKEERDPAAKRELEARAYIRKVIANSAFGYMNAGYAPHGSKAVAMLIMAGGRTMALELCRYLGDAYVVEVDTDGVYFAGRTVDKAQLVLAMRLASLKYGMEPGVYDLDVDAERAAYFADKKQYLLLHDDDSITLHGAAFKGTQHAELFRKTVDVLGRAVLLAQPDCEVIARRALNLSQYPPEDFIKRVKFSGKPRAHVGRQVAESYARLHGRPPDIGERMLYVVTEGKKYEVATPDAFARLDAAYYRKGVTKALDLLGYGYVAKQTSLRKAKVPVSLR